MVDLDFVKNAFRRPKEGICLARVIKHGGGLNCQLTFQSL